VDLLVFLLVFLLERCWIALLALFTTHLHFLMCTTLFCSRSTPGATSTPWLRSSLSPTSQKKPHEATAALTSAAHCVGLNSALQQ
jgi:hypothetical protein